METASLPLADENSAILRSGDQLSRRAGIAIISLGAVLAFSIVILATRQGAGITVDSTRYLAAANNLVAAIHGDALHRLVHYPPLFPVALSLSRPFGVRPIDWARWLNASLMAINIVVAGIMLLRIARGKNVILIAALGVFVLLLSRDVVAVYSSVFSEPLFMTFFLLGLLRLHSYFEDGQYRLQSLIWSAAFMMLACMTRYAGAPFVAAGILSILWLNRSQSRWKHAGIFAGITCSLPTLWCLYNHFTAGTTTNRSIAFHPPTFSSHFHMLIDTLTDWWIPRAAPIWLQLAMVGFATLVLVLAVVQMTRAAMNDSIHTRDSLILLKMLIVFAVVYPVFILTAITLADFSTPLDGRILLPEFTVALFINLILLNWFWQWSRPLIPLRGAIVLFCLAFVSLSATNSLSWAFQVSDSGLGWARKRYTDPALVTALDQFADAGTLYTNENSPLLAESFKGMIATLPTSAGDRKKDMTFRLAMRAVRENMEDRHALILFFSHKARPSEMDNNEIRRWLPLGVKGRGQGWILYAYSRKRAMEAAAARAATTRASTAPVNATDDDPDFTGADPDAPPSSADDLDQP